jgi:hypothetical protein
MVDQDRADGASNDALEAAEELAATEAAAETATDPAAEGATKVVRPRSKTSGRRAVAPKRTASAAGSTPLGGSLITTDIAAAAPIAGEIEDSVALHGSGASIVNARTVDVRQGGIGRVQAVDVAVSQGGIGFARGDRVSVEMGGIGAALGGDVRVTQGGVNMILARDVRIEQAAVRAVVANNVHVERTTGVFVMIARHVEGDVRTLLDWRGAIAFGAAFGVVVSLFRRRGKD